jgi:hypothetical protein
LFEAVERGQYESLKAGSFGDQTIQSGCAVGSNPR